MKLIWPKGARYHEKGFWSMSDINLE